VLKIQQSMWKNPFCFQEIFYPSPKEKGYPQINPGYPFL
jgi:hypothetical protein